MRGNSHVRFGGGRLEKQVMLLAGRLPDFGLTQVLVADDGNTQVYNLFGLDLISQDSGAEVRTLLVDGLGSVRLEMVGSVVETATTYKPYGEVLEQTGTSGTVYGFTGEQEDSATGLLYLRARYYNSSLKTFMTRDPFDGAATDPSSYNGYNYADDNPVMFIDPTGRWICTLDSYLFNPDCDEWVDDALDKLENQGGVPGQRLVAFFEKHDSDIKWSALGCVVYPPLAGRIWGIRIAFNPIIPGVLGGLAAAIPPQDIFVNSTLINGATASLDEVATFGHEISHLEQGFPAFFSVHTEMLSGILTYRLEDELGISRHHPEGVLIETGGGTGRSFDPWDISDLREFKNEMKEAGMPLDYYPLFPVTGFLERSWFNQWGVAPFRPPTPPPSPTPTPPPPTGPARPPTPPPPGGTPLPPT